MLRKFQYGDQNADVYVFVQRETDRKTERNRKRAQSIFFKRVFKNIELQITSLSGKMSKKW